MLIMFRIALPLAAGIFLSATVGASALNFEPSPNGEVIRASGPIEPGDAAKLRKLLDEDSRYRFSMPRNGVTLSLHSPGGSVLSGLELANFVRERGLMTLVTQDSICASACTFVFIGGVKRIMLGKFGIHAMSIGRGQQISVVSDEHLDNVQQLTSTLINLALSMIGDARMITAMLKVPGSDIRLVSDSQLAEWRIITHAGRPTQRMKASFDCGRQQLSNVEKMVCDQLHLADADRRMAAAFDWLQERKLVANLKKEQDRWAKYRDSCNNIPGPSVEFGPLSCVQEAYAIRVGQLEGLKTFHEAASKPPAVNGWKEHTPVKEITTIRDQKQ
jgi:uncharacterized protein